MQRPILITIGLLLLIGQLASPSNAAIGMLRGREPDLWSEGMDFLVVARVADVETLKSVPDEDATHILSLEPLFTVAGVFDPSKRPQLKARAAIGVHGSWVHDVPSKGSIVLAMITPGNIAGDDGRPFPWVATEICHFMPDDQGLVILKGVDDPWVHETLERIRKERAAGEAEAKAAEKGAQAQPAHTPDSAAEQKPKR